MSIKPYNVHESEEVIKVDLKIKKDLYSFLDRAYEFELEEYVVKDVNDENRLITRGIDKRSGEKFTI